jgi:hypothetical protein
MAAGEMSPVPASGSTPDAVFPTIPGYRIEETLGRGSTGVVFRATHLAVDRQVAIKVLYPELCARVKAVRRLQREARTTARLSHPGIVSAVDMGQTGGQWWYAMELVEGESLAERIKRTGKLSQREVVRLFEPLCDALQHAFESGVVHRDIKPGNILIDRYARARLIDLGLAFAEDEPELTGSGGTLGTPHYVSPEQARSPKNADVRSDIWSLGATLFHALCGRPPFEGTSVAEILSGVLYGRVVDPREIEPSLSRDMALVLRKCLSRDPALRYQTPRELADDLECLRERRRVSVRERTLEPLARTRARSRAALAIAGSASVLALALFAWGYWRGHASAGGGPAPAGAAEWRELEDVARLEHAGEVASAAALTALSELEVVDERFRARHAEVSARLRSRWRAAQESFRRRLLGELEGALEQTDLASASELVGEGFAARAQRELNPSVAQLRELEATVGRAELRARVEQELESALARLERELEAQYVQVVPERVKSLRAQGRWKSAKAELLRSPAERAAELGWKVESLPEASRRELLERFRYAAELDADRLDVDWRALDRHLVQWIEERAAAIRARLEQRTQPGAPDEELLSQFAAQRRALVASDAEALSEVSNAAGSALAKAAAALAELDQALVQVDAREWYQGELEKNRERFARRAYAEAGAAWRAARELEWLAGVREQIDLRLQETELLQELLERAAATVREQKGQKITLWIGSVPVEGQIECGNDPLAEGFRLRPAQGAFYALELAPRGGPGATLISVDMLERLAGLDAPGAGVREHLLRALLRAAEGDAQAASALLPLPVPPPELQALAVELAQRLRELEGGLQRTRGEREQRARNLLNVVQRASRERQAEARSIVRTIDELLSSYGDLELVKQAQADLRALRERLLAQPQRAAPDELAAQMGASRAEARGERWGLEFTFDEQPPRSWQSGLWTRETGGWIANGSASVGDLAVGQRWPSWPFPTRVDLTQPLVLEWWIEQPVGSGPPRGIAVSLAGWHLALATVQEGVRGRWLLASGGEEELARACREVFELERGQAGPGLARRKLHRFRLELSQSRGRGVLFLDGELVGRVDLPRPEGKPDTNSVVVRSLEPVRLVRATLECSLR